MKTDDGKRPRHCCRRCDGGDCSPRCRVRTLIVDQRFQIAMRPSHLRVRATQKWVERAHERRFLQRSDAFRQPQQDQQEIKRSEENVVGQIGLNTGRPVETRDARLVHAWPGGPRLNGAALRVRPCASVLSVAIDDPLEKKIDVLLLIFCSPVCFWQRRRRDRRRGHYRRSAGTRRRRRARATSPAIAGSIAVNSRVTSPSIAASGTPLR